MDNKAWEFLSRRPQNAIRNANTPAQQKRPLTFCSDISTIKNKQKRNVFCECEGEMVRVMVRFPLII